MPFGDTVGMEAVSHRLLGNILFRYKTEKNGSSDDNRKKSFARITSSHNIIKRWQHRRRRWFWLTKHKNITTFFVHQLICFVNSGKDSAFLIRIFSDWLKPSLQIVPEKLILSAIEDNWLRCLI